MTADMKADMKADETERLGLERQSRRPPDAATERPANPLPDTRPARRAFVALGSNMGDAAATIMAAVERIGHIPSVTIQNLSPLYRSEPAYLEEQTEFCNAVLLAELDPTLEPLALLHELQAVEREFGRVRTVPNGPRTLDVDIIDIVGVTSADPELLLPHPRALERDFVVTPLLDVSPAHVLADGVLVTRENIAYGWIRGRATADYAESVGGAALPGSTATDNAAAAHSTAIDNIAATDSTATDDVAAMSSVTTRDITTDNTATHTGILSICATPIGNLGDLTLRVIETLKAADVILAEDTRVARKLLSHLDIHTKPERCDENIIRQRSPGIVERIRQGSKVAFVTDAGMPGVADPGGYLIAAVREAELSFEVLPGPSAVLAALVASGFAARSFYFGGFLPRKQAQLVKTLEALASLDAALVFFESPRRALAALAAIAEVFPEREIVLARELTKLHEELLRAPAPDLLRQIVERERSERPLKGEITLVIAPPSKQAAPRVHHDKYAPL
jgi:16S rRNA (cytidine1402-2'-O)-methyltransferase